MADTMDLFAEAEPPAPVDPLDEIAERRRQQEQDRNARRRGQRHGHPCPVCARRTYRRIQEQTP